MIETLADDGPALVAGVRQAAMLHQLTWQALVPDAHTVNIRAEAAEEAAYLDMARAKVRLREHICATYGVPIHELAALATF